MITIKEIAASLSRLLLLVLLFLSGSWSTASTMASDLRLALSVGNGMISLDAHAVPTDKILDQIIAETGVQIFIVGDLEYEEFTGTFENVELNVALRRVLKDRNYAIVFPGYAPAGSGKPGLVVMHDSASHLRGLNQTGKVAVEKGTVGSGHHMIATKQQDRGAAVIPGRKPTRPPYSDKGQASISTAAKTTTVTKQGDTGALDGHTNAGSSFPYDDARNDGDSAGAATNSVAQREAWLERMIEMTQANIDSGYADRRYALDVAECGENNVMHANEYLKYYQEKLDELHTQL